MENNEALAENRNSKMLLGEVYFYTTTILDWKHLLKLDKYKQIVVDSLNNLVQRKKIIVYSFVIIPNHIHLIWELKRLNGKEKPNASLLKFTAHQFQKDLRTNHPAVLEHFAVEMDNRDYNFWQRDPLAIRLYDREICEQKLNYIHNNPLQEKWSLAQNLTDYKWSSASFYELEKDDFGFLTHYMERF